MKHTAITLGPIHKTITNTRSTKAVWSASYMFSWIMRQIIEKVFKNDKKNIILPYFDDAIFTVKYGVGLMPDRLIYKGSKKREVENAKVEILNEFAKKIFSDVQYDNKASVKIKKKSQDDIEKFLQNYLQIRVLEIEIPDEVNPVLEINKYLDTAELQNKALVDADNLGILTTFFEKYNPKYNFFHRCEFGERKFKSTAEIATAEFEKEKYYEVASKEIKRDAENDQEEFYKIIKEGAGKRFRNYQKYIVIVQADGDNMGSFIRKIYEQDNKDDLIKEFSKQLLEFHREAVKEIKNFKGVPVYAGGDDLLFFAPVAHTKIENNGEDEKNKKVVIDKTIFTLIDKIDMIFKEKITKDNEFKDVVNAVEKKPAMSFGLSVSYYKFPLNEALEQSVNQLFYTAKKTCQKNAVSYAVLKHSGQLFGSTYNKDDHSFKTFEDLLKQHISDENILHGVVYKLKPQKQVFYAICLESDEKKRNKLFDNFFFNNFDESVHREKSDKQKLIPFLEILKQLFKDIYSENNISGISDEKEKLKMNENNLNKLYASLRFIGFIHNKEER